MRNIDEILLFRSDLSPFLVHLTKSTDNQSAKEILFEILDAKELKAGMGEVSDAKYAGWTRNLDDDLKEKLFNAICFTETPLNEIHCLLEISSRNIHLEPYGIVFLKARLKERDVSPAIYINNEQGNKNPLIRALYSLIDDYPDEAKQLLPLISVFGQKFQHPGANQPATGTVDFIWEREWRYPMVSGSFEFTEEDYFLGVCPHDEIAEFEQRYPTIKFFDPSKNIKWYASKLVSERQRLNLKYSVV